jgi:predicted AAA+ superfamily ATPase
MIQRHAQNTLLRLAKGFRVLVIIGPRQLGKTTLARITRDCSLTVRMSRSTKRVIIPMSIF